MKIWLTLALACLAVGGDTGTETETKTETETYVYSEVKGEGEDEQLLIANAYWVEGKIGKCSAEVYRSHYTKHFERSSYFSLNPNVDKDLQSRHSWYNKIGWNRGHLAPAADFSWNETAIAGSNYVTNIAPQEPYTNMYIWKKMEQEIRNFAHANHTDLFIVTCTRGNQSVINQQLVVPQEYYKLVCQFNNASDLFLVRANNTPLTSAEQKAQRMADVFTFQDARATLDAMPESFDPLAYFAEHEAFANLAAECNKYPALNKAAWAGLIPPDPEDPEDGEHGGHGGDGGEETFSWVLLVVLLLIVVGILIGVCVYCIRRKRLREGQDLGYIPSESEVIS